MPKSRGDLVASEIPAFDALREWKRARGRELGYNNPCVICHNRTLCEMVRLLPAKLSDLSHVWGMGPSRVEQHGLLMLSALKPFRVTLENARHPSRMSKKKIAAGISSPVTVAAFSPHAKATKKKKRAHLKKTGGWDENAGVDLASTAWKDQREYLDLPSCDWSLRRERCARVDGCAACARYVADGRPFDFAVQSQKLLNLFLADGAYGSHAAAHSAGWRWHARPNHGSSMSHQHKWWPPQAVVEALLPANTKLPLGTNAVLNLLDARGKWAALQEHIPEGAPRTRQQQKQQRGTRGAPRAHSYMSVT